MKWTDEDFAAAGEGSCRWARRTEEWTFGDLEAGFKDAALVLDETFVVQSTGHQPMETRSAMAYWQNGKLYLHGSTQSVAAHASAASRSWVGIEPSRGRAHLRVHGRRLRQQGRAARSRWPSRRCSSKKANAPVMMRISREEEHYIGRARTNMTGRAKVGFRADGRITALDLFIVQDNGAYGPMGDHRSAGNAASLIYQPGAMRWRAVNVADQHAAALSAAVARADAGQRHHGAGAHQGGQAARHRSGRDPHASTRPRARRSTARRCRTASAAHVTSAFVKEALDQRRRALQLGRARRRARASAADRRSAASASPSAPHGAGSSASTGS